MDRPDFGKVEIEPAGGFYIPAAYIEHLRPMFDFTSLLADMVRESLERAETIRALRGTVIFEPFDDAEIELGERALLGLTKNDGQPYEHYCSECGCTSYPFRPYIGKTIKLEPML